MAIKLLAIFLAPILIAGSSIPAIAAASCAIEDLAFMQGEWHSSDGTAKGEERWLLTPANTLAGSSWVAKGSELSFVEALSISPQNNRIEMHLRHFDGSLSHAREEKDSPMVFALERCDGQYAVFDGTGAREGEHITYRRTTEGLTFVGDFLHQGKPVRVEVQMGKATN